MDISNINLYLQRWQMVADKEAQTDNQINLAENWRQLNAIRQRASRLGIAREHDDGEMAIFLLWAKLKAHYVSTQTAR